MVLSLNPRIELGPMLPNCDIVLILGNDLGGYLKRPERFFLRQVSLFKPNNSHIL